MRSRRYVKVYLQNHISTVTQSKSETHQTALSGTKVLLFMQPLSGLFHSKAELDTHLFTASLRELHQAVGTQQRGWFHFFVVLSLGNTLLKVALKVLMAGRGATDILKKQRVKNVASNHVLE